MVSPTPNKGYTYPAHGGSVNAWDTPLNADFDTIDLNIGGYYPITVSSTTLAATFNSSYATAPSTAATISIASSFAANLFYSYNGTMTNSQKLVLPSAGGIYVVYNNSSGAFTLTAGTALSSGASATLSQGYGNTIVCDGVNMRQANSVTYPIPASQLASQSNATVVGNVSGASASPTAVTLGTGIQTSSGSSSIFVTGFAPQASFKNLSIKVATNTTVAVAADYVTMYDGTNFITKAVSATCNLGTNGAVNALDTGTIAIDTWYYIWAIYNGTTTGTLASTSSTAPTMPSGYTYKARIGAVRTIHASATLYGTWQFGRRAQYVVGLAQTTQPPVMVSGNTAPGSFSSPTLTSFSVSAFVPATASKINALATNQYTGATLAVVILAPSNSYTGTNNGPTGSNGVVWPLYLNNANAGNAQTDIILESTTMYWASNASGGAIACLGWEDNI